jgi:hypothetical protein
MLRFRDDFVFSKAISHMFAEFLNMEGINYLLLISHLNPLGALSNLTFYCKTLYFSTTITNYFHDLFLISWL